MELVHSLCPLIPIINILFNYRSNADLLVWTKWFGFPEFSYCSHLAGRQSTAPRFISLPCHERDLDLVPDIWEDYPKLAFFCCPHDLPGGLHSGEEDYKGTDFHLHMCQDFIYNQPNPSWLLDWAYTLDCNTKKFHLSGLNFSILETGTCSVGVSVLWVQ